MRPDPTTSSNRLLMLLNEIGRDTSTFDSLSIAGAVSESLAGDLRALTVFATHYHELNNIADERPNVANFQVMVKGTGEELVLFRQVQVGGASRRYGIQAARLAGVPVAEVQRARQVLDQPGTET